MAKTHYSREEYIDLHHNRNTTRPIFNVNKTPLKPTKQNQKIKLQREIRRLEVRLAQIEALLEKQQEQQNKPRPFPRFYSKGSRIFTFNGPVSLTIKLMHTK